MKGHHQRPIFTGAWVERAACAGRDPAWWSATEYTREERMAKAICFEECPVQRQCLEAGLADPDAFGVWGGLNATQRRKMRRLQR